MKKHFIASLFALTALSPAPAEALTVTPAFEFTSNSTLSDSRRFTVGFSFSLSTAQSVNALGVWKGDMGPRQEVGIWTSLGTLLGSTTVLSTDTEIGNYRWAPFSLALAAGDYVIGATFMGGQLLDLLGGVTTVAGYTYGQDLQFIGAGLNFPTVTTGGLYGSNGIANPNFSVGEAVIPVPAALALFGVALLGLGAARRIRTAA